MSFVLHPYRRFPVYCPVTQTGLFEGHGTVWNLSLTGWRFSGNLPLRIGEVCSLTVILPPYQPIYVAAVIATAVVPTIIAGLAFVPIHLQPKTEHPSKAVRRTNGLSEEG